jgi:hypothetical protein
MREIIFRNLVSQDKQHADFSIREIFEDPSCITSVEKRCIYVIKKQEALGLPYDLAGEDEACRKLNYPKREFFITTTYDTITNCNCFSLKVLGNFYVVSSSYIFYVSFKYTVMVRQEKKSKLSV